MILASCWPERLATTTLAISRSSVDRGPSLVVMMVARPDAMSSRNDVQRRRLPPRSATRTSLPRAVGNSSTTVRISSVRRKKNEEKLAELLQIGTETNSLDYKAPTDLSRTNALV